MGEDICDFQKFEGDHESRLCSCIWDDSNTSPGLLWKK